MGKRSGLDREGCECEKFDLGIRDIIVEELEALPGTYFREIRIWRSQLAILVGIVVVVAGNNS